MVANNNFGVPEIVVNEGDSETFARHVHSLIFGKEQFYAKVEIILLSSRQPTTFACLNYFCTRIKWSASFPVQTWIQLHYLTQQSQSVIR